MLMRKKEDPIKKLVAVQRAKSKAAALRRKERAKIRQEKAYS